MTNDNTRTEWDLAPLLEGDSDPKIQQYREAISKSTKKFVGNWRQNQEYLEKPEVLVEALKDYEAWEAQPGLGNEYFYFGLRTSIDSIDPNLKAKENQAVEFIKDIINQMQFFWLSVGNIPQESQDKFLEHEGLQPYRHWLEGQFRDAKYRLSEAEERILTLKSTPAHGLWVQMTSDFVSQDEREVLSEDGQKIMATEEQMFSLMSSQKKEVRDTAAKAFNEMLVDHRDVAVNELNAILANKKIDDSLRGYERPDQARHAADDIDTDVVDALVEAVSSRNQISHRFYQLRAGLLGLDRLAYHERNIEFGDVSKEYPFDAAAKLVSEVFTGLDSEFAEIFEQFLAKGQIDVFPKKGKRGGAFCAGQGVQHPTYVMLNHTNKLRDVMTVAHEMGHAINNELIRKSQNAINYGTPLSTAEVASTFMEDFVIERLLQDADEETELVLRVRQLDDMVATIFRQIGFYRFEQDLHRAFREKGFLSGDEIGGIFSSNLDAYLGPTLGGAKDGSDWWIYVGHFRNFFYVYSYASGLLISKAMQAKVRQDKAFIKEVKKFLSAGLSKSPKEIFADMGINISDKSFWEAGLDEVDLTLAATEALARKLGKIK